MADMWPRTDAEYQQRVAAYDRSRVWKREQSVPCGDPGAVRCRWCGVGRRLVAGTGVLMCATCDVPEASPTFFATP